MPSLLQRAASLRKQLQSSQSPPTDSRLQGISREDQAEIQREIDEVQQRNRLAVTPDLLTVRSGRRGVLFPVLVNVFAAIAVVTGLFLLPALFTGDQADVAALDEGLASAEGALLRELREETERQLSARDEEIAEVQQRLAALESDRRDLDAEIEQQVSQREQELQDRLEQELAEERGRLEGQDLSTAEVDARLAEYEAQRQAEIDEQLASYVAQLEAERDNLLNELASLESEFESELSELQSERDRIAAEAEAAELEAAEGAADEAEAMIASLRETRERDSQIEQQITGFYDAFRDAWSAGNLGSAQSELDDLASFLNDPQIRSRSVVERRLDSDLFIIESLGSLIAAEIAAEESPADTEATGALSAEEAGEIAEAALQDAVAADSEAAEDLLAAAEEALAADDHARAAEHFMELLREYPRASQREAALSGLGTILTHREDQRSALASEIDALEREREELVSDIASLQTDLAAAESERDSVTSEREGIASELDSVTGELQGVSSELESVSSELETARSENRGLEESLAGERRRAEEAERQAAAIAEAFDGAEDDLSRLAQLQERASRLDSLISSYESLHSLSASGDVSLRERRLIEDFFTASEVDTVLPGIGDRVRRLDETAFRSGRDEGLAEAIDILAAVGSISDPTDRMQYLERHLSTTSGESEIDEITRELMAIIRSASANDL